ncbi:tetratricopeptide repeat protein [Urbifossiella limnaea]|uniref:Lipoprotein NlpI n=1 Tax=Urbifossiella limnaea TaxID=2528023 RepID=A0A517XZ52_9BACT|nr:tetratricopeptide repeat protein [Urbifossiella limnaea]QDU22792.1 lipoprotein NlpI [Urbifossiella limnaea]
MRGAIAVLVLIGGVAAAQDRPADWEGELVVGKKYAKDITFGKWVNDKYEQYTFRGMYLIQVREDKNGWIRVFDGHREAWAKKDEFVLSKDAPAYFTDRIRADPKDTFALWRRGIGWVDRGEYDHAIKDFDEVIRLDPRRADLFNARGVCWRLKEDWDRALADFDEAIRLAPAGAVVLNNRAFVLRVTGELDRALKDYDEAVRLDPRSGDAVLGRAVALLLARRAGAAGEFRRAFDLDG